MTRSNKMLLTAGIIAGPLWIVLSYAQAFTREGFDIVRHPASLLAQGDFGWLQVTAFVIAGALYGASAIGLKRTLTGIGQTWAPIMLGIFGIGMIIGGVFRADPALGFPPGTPLGIPDTVSVSSQIHGSAPILAFIALTACFFILAKRFFNQGKTYLAWASILIGIGSIVLSNIPAMTADMEVGLFNFIPLWIGATVAFLWVSVILSKIKMEYTQN
ncbi:MAG: DUF998 domain-containing protein [bacterium]|nr:DUF998 domain-containing protein [bacterium]